MKIIILALLIMSVNVNAQEVLVELPKKAERTHVTAKDVCIRGYLFAIIASDDGAYGDRGVGIIQILEKVGVGAMPPQPMKCK